MLFEIFHGVVFLLELSLYLHDLLFNLWIGFELSLILLRLEEFLDFLIKSGHFFFKLLVLPNKVGVDAFELFSGEFFESLFDLLPLNDAGIGGRSDLGLVGSD